MSTLFSYPNFGYFSWNACVRNVIGNMMRWFLSNFLFALGVFSVFAVTPAQAYLDGATLSLVLQAVAGAFATFLLYGKMSLARIKGIFKRTKSDR